MRKKILAAAFALLAMACLITACGDDEKTYEPVDYTTDADGNTYVTNVYGDLIPVTTGPDGSIELLEDLYTKTLEQVEEDVSRMEQQATTNGNGGSTITSPGSNGDSGGTGDDGMAGGGVQIGSASPQDEGGREAVIVW